MKQPTIKLIIVITTIALTGLIASQLIWVHKAIVTAREQYDHRVNLALNDVVEELKRMQQLSLPKEECAVRCPLQNMTVFQVIDTTQLKKLLVKYIDYHCLDRNFVFQIHRTSDDSLVYTSSRTADFKKMESHKACLSGLCERQPYHLSVYFPGQLRFVLIELSLWLILSFVFILVIIIIFTWIILAIVKQKKLSEIKNDFINNMTHEFKTPISTISLATEVLMNADPGTSMERMQKYAQIIYEENQRMRYQVERVLQMAQMEKGEYHLNKSKIDVHQVLKNTIHNLCLDHSEKDVRVSYQLDAKEHEIYADRLHVSNIFNNLVDNAVKYSNGKPELKILTSSNEEGVTIEFADNGIGINSEDQRHIFERFYRVHTGNIHNVKGFGLGLYYVKTMIEAHGGRVSVSSEPNGGSRFEVFFPF